jgi:hypothetical protein
MNMLGCELELRFIEKQEDFEPDVVVWGVDEARKA